MSSKENWIFKYVDKCLKPQRYLGVLELKNIDPTLNQETNVEPYLPNNMNNSAPRVPTKKVQMKIENLQIVNHNLRIVKYVNKYLKP